MFPDSPEGQAHRRCARHASFRDCCCHGDRVGRCGDEPLDPLGDIERHARSRHGPLYEPKRRNAHPERDLQAEVKEYLTERGVTFLELVVKPSTFYDPKRRKTVRVRSPMAGWPDLNLIVNGKYCGCELKVKAAQSDAQREAQALIEKGGGIYRICKSVEDVKRLIEELSK